VGAQSLDGSAFNFDNLSGLFKNVISDKKFGLCIRVGYLLRACHDGAASSNSFKSSLAQNVENVL
jgi:hypothetical protein